ncbi:MAG: hypothetical protein RRY54_04280 [Angelakisella sp.]
MHPVSKNSMAVTAAGIAAASVAAGTAAYFINANSKKGHRKAMERKAKKVMHNVGATMSNVVDSVAASIMG